MWCRLLLIEAPIVYIAGNGKRMVTNHFYCVNRNYIYDHLNVLVPLRIVRFHSLVGNAIRWAWSLSTAPYQSDEGK